MEHGEEFKDLVTQRFQFIMCVDIEPKTLERFPQVSEYVTQFEKISNSSSSLGTIKVITTDFFNAKSVNDITNFSIKALDEIGSIFGKSKYFKEFKLSNHKQIVDKYNLKMRTTMFNLNNLDHHTPWFTWFRQFIFQNTQFQKGFLTDVPFCFLYISSDGIQNLPQNRLKNLQIPDLYAELSNGDELKLLAKNCCHILVYLSDDPQELSKFHGFSAFDLVFPMHINNFQNSMSDIFQHINLTFLNTQYLSLQKIISPDQNTKKSIFSSKPTNLQKLRLATYNFQLSNFSDALKIFSSFSSNMTGINYQYVHLMKLLCTIFDPKQNFQPDKVLFQDEVQSEDTLYILLRYVLHLSMIESFDIDIQDFDRTERRIIRCLKPITDTKLKSILRAMAFEEFGIFYFRHGFLKKFVGSLFISAQHYLKLGLNGHVIRCFSLVHHIMYGMNDFNTYFVAGIPSQNGYRSMPPQWIYISGYIFLQLSKALCYSQQARDSLEILLMTVSSESNTSRHDESSLKNLFSILNLAKQGIIEIKDIPLLFIDKAHINIKCYGTLEYFNFAEKEFEDVLDIKDRKFKSVRGVGAITMLWQSKDRPKEQTFVVGEEIIVEIPIKNRRNFSLMLSNLKLLNEGPDLNCSVIQSVEVGKNQSAILKFTLKPSKSGLYKLQSLSFRYWCIIDDIISFDPVEFNVVDTFPSLSVSFEEIPTKISAGQTVSGFCKLTNFGTKPISEIAAISDNASNFKFENPGQELEKKLITKFALQEGLKEKETTNIPFTLHFITEGQAVIKFLFNFRSDEKSSWRFVPYVLKFDVVRHENYSSRIINHQTFVDRQILLSEISTDENDIEINKISIIGKKILDFSPTKVPKHSHFSLINQIIDDPDSTLDQKELSMLDTSVYCGIVQMKTPENTISHFFIEGFTKPTEDVRFSIFADSEVTFSHDAKIEVQVCIKNHGNQPSKELLISPYKSALTKSEHLLWTGTIKKKIRPLQPGEEEKITFIAQPITPGIYQTGYFKIRKGEQTEIVNLSHIIFVRM